MLGIWNPKLGKAHILCSQFIVPTGLNCFILIVSIPHSLKYQALGQHGWGGLLIIFIIIYPFSNEQATDDSDESQGESGFPLCNVQSLPHASGNGRRTHTGQPANSRVYGSVRLVSFEVSDILTAELSTSYSNKIQPQHSIHQLNRTSLEGLPVTPKGGRPVDRFLL